MLEHDAAGMLLKPLRKSVENIRSMQYSGDIGNSITVLVLVSYIKIKARKFKNSKFFPSSALVASKCQTVADDVELTIKGKGIVG